MPTYSRGETTDYREIDRWERGVGWYAHPEERGRRASHAIRTEDGVWLFDPLDAPGVDELIGEFGDVVGVAVLSGYHARDAAAFARRYDVPVTIPGWLDRAAKRIDAPLEKGRNELGGFRLRHLNPMRAWHEAVAYRERDGTLYVPDFLTADPDFTIGPERVAMHTFSRLSPPHQTFADLEPERILFGHGEGVFEDATEALRSGFDAARGRFPRAVVENLPGELRMMLGALR